MTLAKCHTLLSVTFSKDFFSKTTRPISVKFHRQPSGKGRKEVYIFGPGHKTHMATIPINS